MIDDSTHARTPRDPWSVPVVVAQIPVTGLHQFIEPSEQDAKTLAAIGGLRHATNIRAEFDLKPLRNDRVLVTGRVTGTVGQSCVVTLEPIENTVDEAIDVEFAPADQVRALAASVNEADNDDEDSEVPDPPEPIENGVIDLGRVASDALFLGLDPYPRKPDAVFEAPVEEADPDEHPFAALKVLKPKS